MKEVWNPMWRMVRQESLVTFAGLVAVASVGLAGCGNDKQQPTPTLAPTPAVYKLPERMPSATIELIETPTPKPKVISVESSVETDPANPSVETIKLVFPDGIVNGKSPLIPQGDTLSVSLKLNSDARINQLSLSLSDLLSIKNNKFSMGMSAANERDTANVASAIRIFQRTAEFSVSDADQEIINKITLSTVRDGNKDLVVNLSLPNESFTYIDKNGSHLVNPAERFAFGKVGIGIKRGAGSKLALALETKIANGKGTLVAIANRFDITPPDRITAVIGTAQPDRTIPTGTPIPPTKTPEKPTSTPTPRPSPTPAPTPTPTGVPKIYLDVGKDYKFTKCFKNTSTESKNGSIDFESTGGHKENIKTETMITTDLKNIIPEGGVFNRRPGNTCLRINVVFRSGASPVCPENIIYNFRSREPGSDGALLERGSLTQEFCIRGALQGSIDEKSYKYDSTTNTVTSLIVIDNPADIPQQTKYHLIEPCSFLEVAEQEIRDANTDLRIFPDQPQTIPAKTKVRHSVHSTLPYGKVPTSFPPICNVKLDRVLGE